MPRGTWWRADGGLGGVEAPAVVCFEVSEVESQAGVQFGKVASWDVRKQFKFDATEVGHRSVKAES